ncbi:hypothetical protein [Brachymonas denitrificans]|uniref:hypothetical protein n=1 Tax=Brachymonas denitrificans TaxID=28220 RepID=UPI002AFF6BC0|nr:hypothetical protein [Brachymonas denitrificans]
MGEGRCRKAAPEIIANYNAMAMDQQRIDDLRSGVIGQRRFQRVTPMFPHMLVIYKND